MATPLPGFCRDCFAPALPAQSRCENCSSPRLLRHPELDVLTIAHVDCDAFYASVEKRDDPNLRDHPVIIGGGTRGVVSTCCYIARIKGVRSAMPMYKAKQLCPEAIVVKPNMAKYVSVSKSVRAKMDAVTPLVQPLSLDEAFLDLSGTQRLHGQSAAVTLAKLLTEIERDIGITASAGLAPNKYLAKVASDLGKPRGFSVIGTAEAKTFLAEKSVGLIWGVGKAMQDKLAKDGITRIGQLQSMDQSQLMKRYGSIGSRLFHLSRGHDVREVSSDDEAKSIGAETTFDQDIGDVSVLEGILWNLSQEVSWRAKKDQMAGRTITLKLRAADFKSRTRATSLDTPSNLAHRLFQAARPLLYREATGEKFRLIGIGLSKLVESEIAEQTLDHTERNLTKVELAIDQLRAKFGRDALDKGLSRKGKT